MASSINYNNCCSFEKKIFSFKVSSPVWFLIVQCLIFIIIIWKKLVERLLAKKNKTKSEALIEHTTILVNRGRAPFWSALIIPTSSWTQFFEQAQSTAVFVLYSQPIRFIRLHRKLINRKLPVLDQPRGRNSWC